MTKDVALIILAILNISLSISFLAVFSRLNKTTEALEKLLIINELLNKLPAQSDVSDTDVHKESFIKFLSDSRDWAFGYIDEVQDKLKTFIDAVEPDIEHFDEYGVVASSSPHYEPLQRISAAYKELKTLLPEE